MSRKKKIEELKAIMEKELSQPQPDMVKVKRLKEQILTYGLGLTGRDLTKPF